MLDLTQVQCAEEIGISYAMLQSIELGRRVASRRVMQAIAATLVFDSMWAEIAYCTAIKLRTDERVLKALRFSM